MKLRNLFAGALMAVGLVAGASQASSQAVIGKMVCAGTYGNLQIRGIVLADLWRGSMSRSGTRGPASDNPYRAILPQIMRGELHKVPGLVRLFGHMRDSHGRLVNFEVYLTRGNNGTGSVWINGARHRETHMRLFVGRGGFVILPETGGRAIFRCQIATR